jgi:histone H3/H4
MSEIKKANIRFDMDNEMHRKAWQLLQDRDKNRFSSYSQTVVQALIELLSEEASEFARNAVNTVSLSDISEAVDRATEKAIERTLPSFLAGYMACAAGFIPTYHEVRQNAANTSVAEENDEDAADNIDFGFLGLD